MSKSKETVRLNMILFKDSVSDFDECLKASSSIQTANLRKEFDLEGVICFSQTASKKPKWKLQLDRIATKDIDIGDNTSNKVVMLVKLKKRILAILFGYGRSMIKEELIERHFGLKVALNLINPQKMRSIDAAKIEDLVVNTKHQASRSTSQDEFGINVENDIMKGVTGEALSESFKTISGKDTLSITSFMELEELKSKLEIIMESYGKDTYKQRGFEWVDNVKEVNDPTMKNLLNMKLVEDIGNGNIDSIFVTAPDIINWEDTIGFCLAGMGEDLRQQESYKTDIDFGEYVSKIKSETDILAKLKRDRLFAMNTNETEYPICNIFGALTYQAKYEEEMYILNSGSWYALESNFYDHVYQFAKDKVSICDITLPNCLSGEHEGDYNSRVSNIDSNLCLMDRKLVAVLGGKRQIEACDIFTKDQRFIHVKNKSQSSQLSHLFAQGRISAQCFIDDHSYREQINQIVRKEWGIDAFDPATKPIAHDFEIVYAIIYKGEKAICDALPFFSLLNLMLNVKEINRMNYKCSVMQIVRE